MNVSHSALPIISYNIERRIQSDVFVGGNDRIESSI
uniref:Transposase n=1 Tax=Ascaris lumbricoides TaxID=6252 RepID=A0A0M3IEY3_ASCLU